MVRGTVGVCGGQWGCAEDGEGCVENGEGCAEDGEECVENGEGVRRMVRVCGGW